MIVATHLLFAECLDVALSLSGYDIRLVVMPTGPSGYAELRTSVLRQHAAVAILNLDLDSMLHSDGLIRPIAQSGAAVVVITESVDEALWGECLANGARTVIPMTVSLHGITTTLRRIADRSPVMTSAQQRDLAHAYERDRSQHRLARSRLERLTHRERAVLAHLMAGHHVRDITQMASLSEATVRTQVKAILAKLEVTSQIAAVALAHQARWRPAFLPRSGSPRDGS